MGKKKLRTVTSVATPRVVAGRVVSRQVARAPQGLAEAAAQVAAGRCPLCGVRPGATQMAVGPVFVKVCGECSKPVWHVLGLLDWFGTRRKG